MQFRRRSTMLAILATAAGFPALSGSAQAATIQNFWFEMHNDPAGEVSLSDGNVAYDWSHSTISPHVTGTLKVVDGDDANFRVHIDSLDIDNNVLGSTYYTPRPNGFKDDAEHDFAVDMSPTAASNVASVKVMLEKDSTGTWKEKDHVYVPVFRYPKADEVKILDTGVDVGGRSFDPLAHEPVDAAKVTWHIEDDGELTASYDGYLHLESNFSNTVRVQIRALNNAGAVLATDTGQAHYLTTPAYQSFEDKLSVTTADATRLKVKIQEQDRVTGRWFDLNSDEQIVNVAE